MTAIEYYNQEISKLFNQFQDGEISNNMFHVQRLASLTKAKEMESKQLFLASKTLAKEAYESGQQSMYCGCYDIDGCTNYEEWLYKKFKSE